MRVIAANLTMRFYVSNGWTRETLRSCLRRGDVELDKRTEPNYFRLTVGSSFDTDKLMQHVTEIDRCFNQSPHKSDKELIEEYNW